jgi:hypothetical protein
LIEGPTEQGEDLLTPSAIRDVRLDGATLRARQATLGERGQNLGIRAR